MDVNVFTKVIGKVFGFVASLMKRIDIETDVQASKTATAARYTEPKCGVSKCNQKQEQTTTMHSLDAD